MDPFYADDAALLNELKDLNESFMPSTCRVMRSTCETVSGRRVCGEPELVAEVACRAKGGGTLPQEQEAAGRMEAELDGELTLPWGTNVKSGDTIDVTTAGVTTTFEVLGDPWAASYDAGLKVRVTHEG